MIAALFAAALALAPVPPPPANPSTTFYARADAGAELVGLQLVVTAGTARQTDAQSGLAALTAQTLLMTRLDGVTLSDRIAAAGGSIDVVVDASQVRFVVEALPGAMPVIAADFARALRDPDVSAEAVSAARTVLDGRIDDEEKNPVVVGLEMLRNSYLAGSAGAPVLGTRASLADLGPADVAAFLAAHYRRGNAFAAATGSVDDATGAAVRSLIAAFPDGSEAAPVVAVRPFGTEAKRLVTHREFGAAFILIGFAAPAMSDRDFATMLVLRALLGDVATRESASTLSPFERGVNVVYAYDVKPATFTVAINGSQLDPSAGVTVLQAIIKNVREKPLAPELLKRYKETARGQWALEAVSLTDRAWQIGAAVTLGADPDTAQRVAAAIDTVSAADVQRLATKYFQHYSVALVLPRSGL